MVTVSVRGMFVVFFVCRIMIRMVFRYRMEDQLREVSFVVFVSPDRETCGERYLYLWGDFP